MNNRKLKQQSNELAIASTHPLDKEDVQMLTERDFFIAIRSRGISDAAELLKYGTEIQIRHTMDLDSWEKDRPDYDTISQYLTAALGSSPDTLYSLIKAMDKELLISYLHEKLIVHDVREYDEQPPPPLVIDDVQTSRFETPDRIFIVDAKEVTPNDEIDPVTLMDILYRFEQETAMSLLFSVKWELKSQLEELAYQFRSARLADAGFPDDETAQKLYTPPPEDIAQAKPIITNEEQEQLPVFFQNVLGEFGLFAKVVELLSQERQEQLTTELMYLVNAASVAENVRPGDLERITQLCRRVAGYLTIAIEMLWGNDVNEISMHVADTSLQWLFRKGFGYTWQLAKQAAFIKSKLEELDKPPQISDEDIALIEALMQRRPMYLPPDEDLVEMAEPFSVSLQIQEVQHRLDQLEKTV